ncbi:MAG: hypothetical protein JKY46_01225 [Robiginitomaculum sp.]|nr:hypothetical protein [Robiginitomaculum sp.]
MTFVRTSILSRGQIPKMPLFRRRPESIYAVAARSMVEKLDHPNKSGDDDP